jgi:hypothetical protein
VSAPRLRLWPPKSRLPNPADAARDLTISATVQGVIARLPMRGRGGGSSVRERRGSQMRRKTGPAVNRAALCQAASARTGQSSVCPLGQGDGYRVGLRSRGLGESEAQATFRRLQVLDADRGKL